MVYFPSRDEALRDIRVGVCKIFHNRNVFYVEHNQCAIRRVTQRARQRDMPSIIGFPNHFKILIRPIGRCHDLVYTSRSPNRR